MGRPHEGVVVQELCPGDTHRNGADSLAGGDAWLNDCA